MHCKSFLRPTSRREMLAQCASGFGLVALTTLLADDAKAIDERREARGPTSSAQHPTPNASRSPHFPPQAKSVIFLFMDGGPSQVDSFDPKPRLDREHGQPIRMKVPATQFNNVG